MARYTFVDMSLRLMPVVLDDQLVAGAFAHAVRLFVNTSARLRVRHRCAMTRNVTRTKIAIKPQLR